MPKLKRCPSCDEVLYCLCCGERVTPEKKDKLHTSAKVGFSVEQMKKIEYLAKLVGSNKSKFIRRVMDTFIDGVEIPEEALSESK